MTTTMRIRRRTRGARCRGELANSDYNRHLIAWACQPPALGLRRYLPETNATTDSTGWRPKEMSTGDHDGDHEDEEHHDDDHDEDAHHDEHGEGEFSQKLIETVTLRGSLNTSVGWLNAIDFVVKDTDYELLKEHMGRHGEEHEGEEHEDEEHEAMS